MDEFLSEKEQLEQIRDWWKEYGWYLIGGAVLGGALLFGWTRYQSYQQQRVEIASALYDELFAAVADRADVRATELLAEIRAEYASSPYADQAALLMASLRLDQQQPEAAVDELRFVLEDTDDAELALVVRQRLARLLLHMERYDEVLTLLEDLEPSRFSGRFSELRGDVYLAQGEVDRARTAYMEAYNAEFTEVLDRNVLQMKIDDLPVAAIADALPQPEAEPAVEPGAGEGA
ncbi:MAG: tetratricopeptide repeat protein [Gammaproteobacteria bacterium]|nr:tetratricopeptide repeat protein [Gammaproteobacteria bacterium]MDH3505545.1 tetratricopeptide repeat protein [Gammaproteobacteria bacterium]